VLEKYLDVIAVAMVTLGEFFHYLTALCEEPPSAHRVNTSALNEDLPELVAELSVIAENGGVKA